MFLAEYDKAEFKSDCLNSDQDLARMFVGTVAVRCVYGLSLVQARKVGPKSHKARVKSVETFRSILESCRRHFDLTGNWPQ